MRIGDGNSGVSRITGSNGAHSPEGHGTHWNLLARWAIQNPREHEFNAFRYGPLDELSDVQGVSHLQEILLGETLIIFLYGTYSR